MDRYVPLIGLEVHVQLATRTKLFCPCSSRSGGEPNTRICPVCTGQPGTLPVLNRRAVELAVKAAQALSCRVNHRSQFARKNYFYPDLPKGYQISQYDRPLAEGGYVDVDSGGRVKRVGVRRVHLEEDAGKSVHTEDGRTLVDLNRCGVPLLEIVTEPDLGSPGEAAHFFRRLRQLLSYLDVSDLNMEEGALRCDANVSIRPAGESELGTRTELKNLNSFRYLEQALAGEIERQAEIVRSGGRVGHVTMLWNERKERVEIMRGKEEEHDYRYFPEPDLNLLVVEPSLLERMAAEIPELPLQRRERFISDYHLPARAASLLTRSRDLADYFEDLVRIGIVPEAAMRWITQQVLGAVKRRGGGMRAFPVEPSELADLIGRVESGEIGMTIALRVFEQMVSGEGSVDDIIRRHDLRPIVDSSRLNEFIERVLADFPDLVKKYRAGKTGVLDRLVGEVMRRTDGRAEPHRAKDILREKLTDDT